MHMALTLIYGAACTIVGWYGLRALYRMGPRTPHVRRAAFVFLTLGAGCGYIESFQQMQPMASAFFIALGACLLLIVGARTDSGGRSRRGETVSADSTMHNSAFNQ